MSSLITDPQLSRLIRTITGVLLLLVLLRPLLRIDLEDMSTAVQEALSSQGITEDYHALYEKKLREHIISTTEAYIREKASSIGAEIRVEVDLREDPYPTPSSVRITGALTPHQQELLRDYLTRELGIDPGNQRWNLYDEHS